MTVQLHIIGEIVGNWGRWTHRRGETNNKGRGSTPWLTPKSFWRLEILEMKRPRCSSSFFHSNTTYLSPLTTGVSIFLRWPTSSSSTLMVDNHKTEQEIIGSQLYPDKHEVTFWVLSFACPKIEKIKPWAMDQSLRNTCFGNKLDIKDLCSYHKICATWIRQWKTPSIGVGDGKNEIVTFNTQTWVQTPLKTCCCINTANILHPRLGGRPYNNDSSRM